MRWPFVSREHHEEVVRELKARLAEADDERKKLHDEYYKALGANRLFAPDVRNAETAEPEAEPESTSAEQDDFDRLRYIMQTRPAHLGTALTELMKRRQVHVMPIQQPIPPATSNGHSKAPSRFDEAEREVKERNQS